MANTRDRIQEVLQTIDDPEMPISIVELGLVEGVEVDGRTARIRLMPTFVGCPALDVLRQDVVTRTRELDEIEDVEVEFVMDPAWSVDRISERGRERLREIGITVPKACGSTAGPELIQIGLPETVPCPYCDSRETRRESVFGPTRCRMIYYCDACKNQFEHMKRVGAGEPNR